MKSIEEMIELNDSPQFRADCETMFQGDAAKRVLVALCNMAHPLEHVPVSDPILAAHRRGRSEVVAALWSRSQPIVTPRDVTIITNTTNADSRQ